MIGALRERISHVARWIALAVPVGIVSGLLSAAFIASLDWATDTRETRDWLVWGLPVFGLAVGWVYMRLGSELQKGSNLVIEQIHSTDRHIPFRLVPLIFGASVLSHLGGASVGREGAAVQLAAGVADPYGKKLGIKPAERSLLLVTAIAAGFGSVFGVPVAGAVFALEVHRVGRVRYEALVPAFVASFTGDAVVRRLGVEHTHFAHFTAPEWEMSTAWRTILLGVVAGLVALAFSGAVHTIKSFVSRIAHWPPLVPMIGGVAIVILAVALDWRDYQGLSIQLALDAHRGSAAGEWMTKFALTAISIGTGFVGGEVIPLVVIGSLLGASIGDLTGGNIAMYAMLGAVAVLAGAANTPLACTILGLELFGGEGVVFFAVVCAVSYAASGRTGIYHAQHVSAPKSGLREHGAN
ncbi:MAG: hypothetical protein RLY50_714 [Actinomycetota bacterium]